MTINLWQAAILFFAIWIAIWAIKRIIANFAMSILSKKRFCTICIEEGDGDVKVDCPWRINNAEALYLCEECKQEQFPGQVGEFVIQKGYLVYEPQENES